MTFVEIGFPENEYVTCEPSSGSLELEEPELLSPEDSELKIGNSVCKIKLPEFPLDKPWLPQKALLLLDKLKKGPVSEKELMTLMELIANQATNHFQLRHGEFVALSFFGRVVDISDTRVGLLKKIQGRKSAEEIFVWKVGFDSFSGRT
jgi:hypothetical protein